MFGKEMRLERVKEKKMKEKHKKILRPLTPKLKVQFAV